MREYRVLFQSVIIALFLAISSSFAVLDTIVLQQGLNQYTGATDRYSYSSSTGLKSFFQVGAC